jgi:hypothetical protein
MLMLGAIRIPAAGCALLVSGALVIGCTATVPSGSGADGQSHFATPRALVEALVNACRSQDTAALVAAVGPANQALVESGDPAADRARCQRFVASADTMTRLDPAGADRVVLVVGSDDYPLPVPLVKDAEGWRLDTSAGAAEIMRRTIGANELRAIAVCQAAARGQAAPAVADGYAFRALPGPGAKLVAYPNQYRRTGVFTFLVAGDGAVYQKDMGADTGQAAGGLTGAAPDASWSIVPS